jgi:hypothetical protein
MTEELENRDITHEVIDQDMQNQEASDGGLAPIPNINFNRKFRRSILKQSGYIGLKNRLQFRDWFENIKNNIKNGKQLHMSNVEDAIRSSQQFMEKRNESTAEFLLSKGHSEEQAAEIIEKNMQIQERIAMKKIKK